MTEQQVHKQVCDYIKLQYPKVLFNTDLSGIKLTIGQATKLKALRSNKGFPDLTIFKTAGRMVIPCEDADLVVFQYSGLFLEFKKETPFKKNGELKKSEHLEEQNEIHKLLRKQGYLAVFCWSFEMAKKIIDDYMKL